MGAKNGLPTLIGMIVAIQLAVILLTFAVVANPLAGVLGALAGAIGVATYVFFHG